MVPCYSFTLWSCQLHGTETRLCMHVFMVRLNSVNWKQVSNHTLITFLVTHTHTRTHTWSIQTKFLCLANMCSFPPTKDTLVESPPSPLHSVSFSMSVNCNMYTWEKDWDSWKCLTEIIQSTEGWTRIPCLYMCELQHVHTRKRLGFLEILGGDYIIHWRVNNPWLCGWDTG